nr:SPOR domain-containing protein [Helicobacter cetorum]
MRKMVLFISLSLSLNAFGLDCKKSANNPKCVQNAPKTPVTSTLKETHEGIIEILDSMGKSTQYEPLKIKEILKRSEQEWLDIVNQECVALNMLVSPKTSIENSPVYKSCYEAYAKQRIHDLNDFYQESKKVKKKIKQVNEREARLNLSKKSKKEFLADATNLKETPRMDSVMAKGYYLQVGAFSNAPNKDFLQALKAFSYQVETKDALTRYFIGPYKTQEEALQQLSNVAKNFNNKPLLVERH